MEQQWNPTIEAMDRSEGARKHRSGSSKAGGAFATSLESDSRFVAAVENKKKKEKRKGK
jgi:hypothetical protein